VCAFIQAWCSRRFVHSRGRHATAKKDVSAVAIQAARYPLSHGVRQDEVALLGEVAAVVAKDGSLGVVKHGGGVEKIDAARIVQGVG
jgi:hypothetical protein